MLLKLERYWRNNIAEMEAELMKEHYWNGSEIDEKALLKWKLDCWKNIAYMEAGLMENIAEMEARLNEKYCWMRGRIF